MELSYPILEQWISVCSARMFKLGSNQTRKKMENKEHIRAMEQWLHVLTGKGWLHGGIGYAGEEYSKAKI
jgi:hypothetical protein